MNNSDTISNSPLLVPTTVRRSLAARGLLRGIATYQFLTANRVAPCRFYPSCSKYAAEAVATHGACRGALLAVRRLSRCRPFGPHGIDLVPEPTKPRSSR